MIRTIIFDLGRVIVPFDFHRIYQAFAEISGEPAERFVEARPTDLVVEFEHGRVAPDDFAREYCRRMNIAVSHEQFCEIWCSIFFPETLISEQLIRNISRTYCSVLLSNTNAIHFEMIRRTYPLLGHFRHLVLSHEVGVMKPSAQIYRLAVEAAGCRPEECFFTDDVAEYVEGAKDFGIDAVQFESEEQVKRELNLRGVRTDS